MNTIDFVNTIRKATFEHLKYYMDEYKAKQPDMMVVATNALRAIKEGKEDYDRYRKERKATRHE